MIPSQDPVLSMAGHPSRRSLDSDHSSLAGTIPGKPRGDGTPKRVSFEGDRPSFSASYQNVRNGKWRFEISLLHKYGLIIRPTALNLLPASFHDGRANDVPLSPPNAKPPSSPARSSSPLRSILWPLHRSHAQEEAFVPVDPYKPNTSHHALSQIFRQIYRHALLRLPSIYFSRVCRVFEDAEVSRPEVERMVQGREKDEGFRWPSNHEWVVPNVSPALIRFKESWESFVDSVLKEWKTLNVVSALLLTCVVFSSDL